VDLSAELRDRRKAANRTIASVAVDAGLSVPYIANLENGRGNPTLAALDRLATALGTNLQLTLVDDPPGRTADPAASSGPRLGSGSSRSSSRSSGSSGSSRSGSSPGSGSADLLAASPRAARVIAELSIARSATRQSIEQHLITTLDALSELLPAEPTTADLDRLLDLLLLAAES
jgi:transcriptional regulator with XRE-family HTH domain